MPCANLLYYFHTILLAVMILTKDSCTGIKIVNGCPERFARSGMHCTTILFEQLPWEKADAECKNKASIMFMIKDKATYDQILNVSPSNATEAESSAGASGMPSMPGNLMMGLKYTASDKKWHWADGTEYNPGSDWALWMSGSPPTPSKDGCVIWKKKGKEIKWDMADCNTPGFTICYVEATSKVQTCPDRYMQVDQLCIMVVMKLDSSYNSGSADCKAAGGGMIAMLKEENQLKDLQTLGGGAMSKLPIAVWMGLKYYAAEGKWKWSDGNEYKMGTDWGLWSKPPGTPSEDTCVTMTKSMGGDRFEWNTEKCDAPKGLVVCSRNADPDPTGQSAGNVEPKQSPGGGGGSGARGIQTCIRMVLLSSTMLVALVLFW